MELRNATKAPSIRRGWLCHAVAALFALPLLSSCGGDGGAEVSGQMYWNIVVADFDGDGWPDIAGSYSGGGGPPHAGYVAVFLQDAAHPGQFLAPAVYAVGNDPVALVAADLDGDGRVDLVTANSILATSGAGVSSVSVLLQTGQPPGTFGTAVDYATGTGPKAVAVGDFTGDGRPDLLVAASDGLSMLPQSTIAAGRFEAARALGFGSHASFVTAADLNADGHADLIGIVGEQVVVALQDPTRAGSFIASYAMPAGQQPLQLAVGDLDGDTLPDIAVANYGSASDASSASVAMILQRAGGFAPAVPLSGGVRTSNVAIADLDVDGVPDVAASNAGTISACQAFDCNMTGSSVAVLLQDASVRGRFAPAVAYPPAGSSFITWVVAADIDRDGRVDLVIAQGAGLYVRLQDPTQPGGFLAPARIDR